MFVLGIASSLCCCRPTLRTSPELTHVPVVALAQFQDIRNVAQLSVSDAASVAPGDANSYQMGTYTDAFTNSTCSSYMSV
jgi:hypothetical protein